MARNNGGSLGEDTDEMVDINAAMSADEELARENTALLFQQKGAGSDEQVRIAPKKRIILHNTGDVEGDKPVFFAVNGVGFMVPREKPVLVPAPLVGVIMNAVETRYFRDESDNGPFGQVKSRQVNRFPITILD